MKFEIADVFADNLVLQRDRPIPIWGWAAPGSRIEVRFADRIRSTCADQAGRWEVRLDALPASSEPRQMVVHSGLDDRVVRNVLVGDVWLCSGQSNMALGVAGAMNGAQEVKAADYPSIRVLTVPNRAEERSQPRLGACAVWQACSPAVIGDFSAVGYFFGRELFRRLQVPVGLINSSWGGSSAEAWISQEGLLSAPELKDDILERFRQDRLNLESLRVAHADRLRVLAERTRDTGNIGWDKGWADAQTPPGNWKETDMPWTGLRSPEGLFFSGVLWFRKTLDLPSAWAGQDLRLALGACDTSAVAYFNNVPLEGVVQNDRPAAQRCLGEYAIPGRLVRSGSNVIAVRAHLRQYAGGLTGPAASMTLTCPARPGCAPLSLAGAWRYAVEQDYGIQEDVLPPTPDIPHHSPCHLFNAMIAPLAPFAMRGVIWYQGEANAGQPRQYRILFPALIQAWRRHWGQGDFPFLFVQLPNFNYQAESKEPRESQWADIREAQALALSLPQTGMAVTLDIGEASNIHPANKQDVGLRLALLALADVYAVAGVEGTSPLFREVRRDGSALRVYFAPTPGGLVCRGSAVLGFAVAGKDGKYAWAQARIEGETVRVWAPSVPAPKTVRYAWADNPHGTLASASGLPVAPFRSDGARVTRRPGAPRRRL